MKLFLLDAYAIIYRAYYAFIRVPRLNYDGFDTSAIFGFVNTLEKILKNENPTHICVVFDPIGPTFRHKVYKNYKSKREKTPEIIQYSVPIIKKIISAYRIPILEISNYEADDVIGTIAKKISKDYKIFIITQDKDYVQLVDEHIFIYKLKRLKEEFEILGKKEIMIKYGFVNPLQMIDFLALMGDYSDNIPGCPGIGKVTAKKLIAKFGDVENLLKNVDLLRKSLKTKIENNKEVILFSKFLATIKTDVPIDFNENDLKRKKINEPVLQSIFEKLEFRQLSSRIFSKKNRYLYEKEQGSIFLPSSKAANFNNYSTDLNISNFNSFDNIYHKYYLLDKKSDISSLITKIRVQNFFAFDIKSYRVNSIYDELFGLSISLQEGEAFFIQIKKNNNEYVQQISKLLKEILESKSILKVGQNLKFCMNVLKKYGIRISNPIFDTLIAHYLINPEYQHDLGSLSKTYLNYKIINTEKLINNNDLKNQVYGNEKNLDFLVNYACESADIILRLKNIFEPMIYKNSFEKLFYKIEMPLVSILSEMEEFGVGLDIIVLKNSSIVLKNHLKDIESKIFQISKKEFNISSPRIVGELLFNRMKIIKNPRKTKLGQYITSENILEKLKNKYPIVEKILRYRKIKKILTNYVDVLPSLVDQTDKKIHTTYNQATTATGRLSSTNPNLQNIPIKDNYGKEIRRAFVSDNDCLFLSVDYSQIELRIVAHLSDDKNMLKAFQCNQDIHLATAANIFNIPLSEVTNDMRRKAKIANFSIIYGISTFGLSEQLQISFSEAKKFINDYFITFPDVKDYIDRSINIARKNGYAETIFHRKRFLPNINSQNAIVRKYAERNAINTPVQGSAADIIKIAMNKIYKRFKNEKLRSKMIMQVHDELNFNVSIDELDKVKQIVIYEMEHVIRLKAPLVIEYGIGKNWLEAH
ncbi:MAG: DNA polymerase I [Bacteroidales bacterium OttesenSCG-928-I14]|jgi:DNA polymerase-1|nr:DNA polymerase I [Bacteroidales bacterium OttesenSCG-928-I14]